MLKVKRVLISVSDKKGIVAFAQGLHALGVAILSTGGTAKLLRANDIDVACILSEDHNVGHDISAISVIVGGSGNERAFAAVHSFNNVDHRLQDGVIVQTA